LFYWDCDGSFEMTATGEAGETKRTVKYLNDVTTAITRQAM